MSESPHTLGKRGEDLAAAYLIKAGYRILCRNYRAPEGEIDLIAEQKGTLVFVEVKSRSSDLFGEGYEAVNTAKQKKLRRLALFYLQEHGKSYRQMRFDVLSLLLSRNGELRSLKHFKGAF